MTMEANQQQQWLQWRQESVETLTEKCPSASLNPDSQAYEFKGVKSKGYLLISYPLLLR